MKTIGLLGGMTWSASLEYYRTINERINKKLGGFHCAKSVMYTVDFDKIQKLVDKEQWKEIEKIIIDVAKKLQNGGADFTIICCNTIHKMADEIQKNINIPLIHIADTLGEKISSAGHKKIGLLGTKFTMKENFYKDILIKKYGMEIIIPEQKEIQYMHNVIINELCLGDIKQDSKNKFKLIIENLAKKDAQAVILGCTEIPMLIKKEDAALPLFDPAKIHAEYAADFAIDAK